MGNTDAGRDWGQEEKGMTEDEMAGWHIASILGTLFQAETATTAPPKP